jgi:hypothetical protein
MGNFFLSFERYLPFSFGGPEELALASAVVVGPEVAEPVLAAVLAATSVIIVSTNIHRWLARAVKEG